MRTTAKIDHPKMDISIYLRENKYIVKIVLGQLEQVYRINETDVTGMDDMKALVSNDFLTQVYLRFVEMSKDLKTAFNKINTIQS